MNASRWLGSLVLVLSLGVGGCAAVYTRSREVRLPAPLSHFVIGGRMSVGLLYRDVTISVNGRDVLSGRSYFWSNRIRLSGEVEGLPLAADCDADGKTCTIELEGIRFPSLRFDQ